MGSGVIEGSFEGNRSRPCSESFGSDVMSGLTHVSANGSGQAERCRSPTRVRVVLFIRLVQASSNPININQYYSRLETKETHSSSNSRFELSCPHTSA